MVLFCFLYLKKEHHLDALPEGWFYNGLQYVSMEGERSNIHPGRMMLLGSAQLAQLIIVQLRASTNASNALNGSEAAEGS
jgi:hypothetical protein